MNHQDEEKLTRALKALAAEMEPLAAPDAVELKLREAFRKQNVVTPFVPRRSSSRYWLAAAIAAMLLIAVSVVAYRMNRRVDDGRKLAQQDQPQSSPKVVDDSVKEEPMTVAQEEKSLAHGSKPKRVRHPNVRRPESAQQLANHAEIATDFIPLSYMSAVNLQDGGQIVRVELPRSALANFGLPVNMDRYNEKVKADVLFGVDGLAHAIRFIQ
jgi:hypothetical protein